MNKSTTIKSLFLVAVGLLIGGCATSGAHHQAAVAEFSCPVCSTGYLTEAEWQDHVQNHHRNTIGSTVQVKSCKCGKDKIGHGCPVCNTGFMTEAEWQAHVAEHHPGKKVAQPALRLKRTKHGKTEYACPVCGTDYVTEEQWKASDSSR